MACVHDILSHALRYVISDKRTCALIPDKDVSVCLVCKWILPLACIYGVCVCVLGPLK